jgi:uncharacterized MAPEG superfamily protein
MSIAYICVTIVIFLPYVWVIGSKINIKESGVAKRYENQAPREQQARLDGWRLRAVWAQNNAFEATPAFVGAILLAMHAGVPADIVNAAAVVFTAARIVHGAAYLANQARIRSSAWAIGVLTIGFLLIEGIRHLP